MKKTINFNFDLPKGFKKNGDGTDFGKLTLKALSRAAKKK